ncbi:hypothetical protein ES705_14958 [subsurface metagenome]
MSVRDQVLRLLLDYPDATYETIGGIVGVSKQRVHQIAKDAGLTRKRRPPHYRSDITIDKVLELYHSDLLIQEIAPTLGCCPRTVRSRLREAGIGPGECFSRSMRLDWRGSTHYRDDVTVERVFNLYHNGDLLIKEIAQTLGCNQATVSSRLREARISKSQCFSRGAVIKWKRRKRKDEGAFVKELTLGGGLCQGEATRVSIPR